MTLPPRAELVRIASDVLMQQGDAAQRRTEALRQGSAKARLPGLMLGELAALPRWQRGSRDGQRAVARRAALLSMAPALAASIDGVWLGALAEATGEEDVDRAIARADDLVAVTMPPVEAGALEERGFALMRATLPPAAHRLIAWADAEAGEVDIGAARLCVALAQDAG